MTISSSDVSSIRASSSSLSKLEQKKLVCFKKKNLGPENKRVPRLTPVKLTPKVTLPLKSECKESLQERIDNIRKQAADNTRKSQQGVVDMNSPAMHQAKEIQSKLPPEFPSFVKYMLKSHVCRGFWLSFPKPFCAKHMPVQDKNILLVGERVKEHKALYLVEKNGLSGGWRGFVMGHKLLAGDVLVFQLIESLKFKVHIVRASDRAKISHVNLNSHAKTLDNIVHSENELEDDKNDVEMITADKHLKPSETQSHQSDGTENSLDSEPIDTPQQTENGGDVNGLDSEPVANLQQTEDRNDELRSEDVQGIRLAKFVLEFKDVKGFDSFNIILDGLIIDTEIPIHLRFKYYELCRSQKSFLHDDLVKGLNCKLVAGIISEIVNIADAIKAAKFTVSLEHLQSWDKTLKAFEGMGMKVGFLRTCLNKLVCLLYEQQEIIRSKTLEQTQLEAEIRDLENKLSTCCEVKKTLDVEIEGLMVKDSSLEIPFRNIATTGW